MTKGELDTAIRRALNILDEWVNVTGVVEPGTGYYYEMQACIEDAVHCGAQAATGDYRRLDSEIGSATQATQEHAEITRRSAALEN